MLFDAPGPAIGASGSALQNPKEVFTLSSLLCKAGAPEVLTQCDETAVKTIIKKINSLPHSSSVFLSTTVFYRRGPGFMGGGCLSALGGGVAGEQRRFLFYFHIEELCFIFFFSWK